MELLRVICLASRFLRWFLGFLKVCASLADMPFRELHALDLQVVITLCR